MGMDMDMGYEYGFGYFTMTMNMTLDMDMNMAMVMAVVMRLCGNSASKSPTYHVVLSSWSSYINCMSVHEPIRSLCLRLCSCPFHHPHPHPHTKPTHPNSTHISHLVRTYQTCKSRVFGNR